jgi:hypothetical protein
VLYPSFLTLVRHWDPSETLGSLRRVLYFRTNHRDMGCVTWRLILDVVPYCPRIEGNIDSVSFRVFPALKAMCVESGVNREKEVLRFQHNDQDSILKENYEREEANRHLSGNRGRIEDFFPNSPNVSHQPMRKVPNCTLENRVSRVKILQTLVTIGGGEEGSRIDL